MLGWVRLDWVEVGFVCVEFELRSFLYLAKLSPLVMGGRCCGGPKCNATNHRSRMREGSNC